jgi:proteic killer suppression protein
MSMTGCRKKLIKSFLHKGLKDFFYNGTKKGINASHASKLESVLDRLDAAAEIRDMNYPGAGLHLLEPKKNKIYAVLISGNWRVTFKITDGNAYVINYLDYH